MSKVIFNYEGANTNVLCQENEKMIEICKRFGNKAQIDIKNFHFLYNGNKINIELRYDEIANKFDKERKEVSILVLDINNTEVLDIKKNIIEKYEDKYRNYEILRTINNINIIEDIKQINNINDINNKFSKLMNI